MKNYYIMLLLVTYATGLSFNTTFGEVSTAASSEPANEEPFTLRCPLPFYYNVSFPLSLGSKHPLALAISSNGLYAATANFISNDITVYTGVATGELDSGQSHPLPSGIKSPRAIVFAPNNSYLATTGDLHVVLYTIGGGVSNNGTALALPPDATGGPWALAIAPNSLYLAATYSTLLGSSIALYTIGAGGVFFSPADSYPLLAGSDGSSLVFSGPYLAVANFDVHSITLFTISAGGVLSNKNTFPLPVGCEHPFSIAISPDGAYLATANYSTHNITLFSLIGGVPSMPISKKLPQQGIQPVSIAFSPNGFHLATANFGTHDRSLFLVGANQTINDGKSYSLPIGSLNPTSIAFTPDGRYLATSNATSRDASMFKPPTCFSKPTS